MKYGSEETNPNVSLLGVDENHLTVSGYEIQSGRNFSADEVQGTRHLVLIGSDIVRDLFPSGVDPLGKVINVAGLKLQVAGVLKSKGASAINGDNVVFYACHYRTSVLFTSQYVVQYYGYAYAACKPGYVNRVRLKLLSGLSGI